MPLIKSGSRAAVSENISEMEHAGHPHNQAIAAALSNARKYGAKFAGGGFAPPMGERFAQRQLMHEGFLHSPIPGRTDKLPITVGGGAYVLPADHVAAVGQGNSLAGSDIINRMFRMGPYGAHIGNIPRASARGPRLNLSPKAPKSAQGGNIIQFPYHRSRGGAHGHGHPTPIIAAGGEIVIPPDKIAEYFGDLDKGHKALDKWVVETRKKHISTLKTLKPPRKD